MNNNYLTNLEQQLEAVNTIKQENDKEIKRCRKIIQEKIKANESLQNLSNKLYKQIQEIKNPKVVLSLSDFTEMATNGNNLFDQFLNQLSPEQLEYQMYKNSNK